MDGVFGDHRLNVFGDIFDDACALAVTALQSVAMRTTLQPVRFRPIDLGSLVPPNTFVPFPGTRLLASLGCIRLGLDRHHTRWRGGRRLWPGKLRFQFRKACILFGNASAGSPERQRHHFGAQPAEPPPLRLGQFAAKGGLDQCLRRNRPGLPWLHAKLHSSSRSMAQMAYFKTVRLAAGPQARAG